MIRLAKTTLLLIICCFSFLAQAQIGFSFGQGSVPFAINPPEGEWISFSLCCGQPDSYGFIVGGSFDFQNPLVLDATFNLVYTGQGICEEGCTFTANFSRWFAPVLQDNNCFVQGATLDNGILATPYKTWTGFNSNYFQEFCKISSQSWSADGGLTAVLNPGEEY